MHKQKIILELLLKVEARLLAMLKPIRRQRWWKGKFAFFWRLAIWGASQVVLLLKNLLAMQETWVQSLGWEDTLEKGKVTRSSILAWRLYSP